MDLLSRRRRRFPRRSRTWRASPPASSRAREKTDRSYRIFARERRVRFTEMEYAIPREHGPEAVAPGARAWCASAELPVGFPIEFRLVAPDDALLSPAHERETAYIAVHQYRGATWEPYFRAVEEIMYDYGGPPALGQAPLPDRRDAGAALSALARLPARSAPGSTPSGGFSNAYTERVLGPVGPS